MTLQRLPSVKLRAKRTKADAASAPGSNAGRVAALHTIVQKLNENVKNNNKRRDEASSDTSLLPGSNPYDRAVAAGVITYAEAKTRDELHTRQAIAKLELEKANLDIEERKLENKQRVGLLIAREDYLARQESLVSTFVELLRLYGVDLATHIPASMREAALSSSTDRAHAAMHALADAVTKKEQPDVVRQRMHDAFREGE
jgi:hypothetical protein